MKDLAIFIALGLNALMLSVLLVFGLGQVFTQGVSPEAMSMALMATAPASAVWALGTWRRARPTRVQAP